MKTVNSLSGGKTSSYIAVHYPADYEIFALCCINTHNAGVHIDKKMRQMVNDKLQKYCSHMPEFWVTSEDPKVLKVMFDLEQMIGREIIWVRGIGWEDMIRSRKAIPNIRMRFCTTVLKMDPIFEFLFKHTEFPVKMRIGFRYDEAERAENIDNHYRFAYMSQYQEKALRWVKRWQDIVWRECEFPLIEDKIFHHQVNDWWIGKGIEFPEDSNCQNCFWKQEQQLRKNFDTNQPIMCWSMVHEDLQGHTFKKSKSLREIGLLELDNDFIYGTGAGRQAGFCTN